MMGEPRGLSHILNPPMPSSEPLPRQNGNGTSGVFSENGRLYHAREIYPYPTDERERCRYDMIHHMIHCIILGHVDKEPMLDKDDQPMMNVGFNEKKRGAAGTGSAHAHVANTLQHLGSWMWKRQFPDAEITGVDIVGGQPARPGPNLTWRTPDSGASNAMNFEAREWPLPGNSFDLVHAAHLCGSVSEWPKFYEKCRRVLRPKTGRIELFEIDFTTYCDDNTLPNNSPIHVWWDLMQKATRDKPIAYRADTGEMLQCAGFVDIEHQYWKLPFHGNDRKRPNRERAVGEWYKNMLQEEGISFDPVSMINGLSMGPLTRNLGMSRSEVDRLVGDVLLCIEHRGTSAYHVLHSWTARRPGSNENL
ncbi:hypothetical protein Q7P37_003943 [Cladosporium fusiforme]